MNERTITLKHLLPTFGAYQTWDMRDVRYRAFLRARLLTPDRYITAIYSGPFKHTLKNPVEVYYKPSSPARRIHA